MKIDEAKAIVDRSTSGDALLCSQSKITMAMLMCIKDSTVRIQLLKEEIESMKEKMEELEASLDYKQDREYKRVVY